MATTASTGEGSPLGDHTGPGSEPEAPVGPTFSEVWFDDPVEGESAQRAALELKHRIEIRAKPIRFYLEETVVPLLLQGLQHLVLERPSNPVQYLAAFLLKNDPCPPPEPIKGNGFEEAKQSILENRQSNLDQHVKAEEQQSKPNPDLQSKVNQGI